MYYLSSDEYAVVHNKVTRNKVVHVFDKDEFIFRPKKNTQEQANLCSSKIGAPYRQFL